MLKIWTYFVLASILMLTGCGPVERATGESEGATPADDTVGGTSESPDKTQHQKLHDLKDRWMTVR